MFEKFKDMIGAKDKIKEMDNEITEMLLGLREESCEVQIKTVKDKGLAIKTDGSGMGICYVLASAILALEKQDRIPEGCIKYLLTKLKVNDVRDMDEKEFNEQ